MGNTSIRFANIVFIGKYTDQIFLKMLIFVFSLFLGLGYSPQATAIDPEVRQKLAMMVFKDLNGYDKPDVYDKIDYWGALPSKVTMQALLARALHHVRVNSDPDPKFLVYFLRAAGKMTSANSSEMFNSYVHAIVKEIKLKEVTEEELHSTYALADETEELLNEIGDVAADYNKMSLNSPPLPVATEDLIEALEEKGQNLGSLNLDNLEEETYEETVAIEADETMLAEHEMLQSLPVDERFQKGIEKIEAIRDHLEKTVIGQPEVIEAFIDIEYMKLIYGKAHPKGVTVKLMGLPGVGKDTAAMAWVDAIHGEDGAWVHHLLRMPPIRHKSDLSKYIGSPPGYVGSDDLPILIKFLVEHSGGKYLLKMKKEAGSAEKPWFVALNPEWQGENLPGYLTPDDGVVFLNEKHNWSKAGSDAIKTFIEEGRVEIANPGTGEDDLEAVNEVTVPVRRIEASNELISLIATNRRADGTNIGAPQEYDELFENWERNHANYAELRKQIMAEGSARSDAGSGDESSAGVSQEYLNRIKDAHLLLMRPLSPEDVQKIVRIKLRAIAMRLNKSPNGFRNLQLDFSDELVRFIQEWDYIAEEGARASESRIESLVEHSLIQAIKDGRIYPSDADKVELDIARNQDGTYNLVFHMDVGDTFDVPIASTASARHEDPLTPEELQETYTLGKRLSEHVFGVESLTSRIGDQIASRLVGRNPHATVKSVEKSAQVYMFLGLSSTGKTELSKAIAREVYEDEGRLLTIPFGEIKTADALQEWITGSTVGGKVKKSKLMEMWDKTNGNFVLNLDELSNAPLEVQEGLYDLLREKTYSNFVDREPRVTENLIITITGNAGEDWFTSIPRNIPIEEQQAAMYEIYRKSTANSSFLRHELEQHFKKALINRVGMSNIFFFPPLSYQAIRQLTQHRLLKSIESLKYKRGSREPGWNVQFLDEVEFEGILKVLETEGFELFEQGASLVRFVQEDFEQALKVLLGRNGVALDSDVTLYLKSITEDRREETDRIPGKVTLGVLTEDGRELELDLKRRKDPKDTTVPDYGRIFVAFHEAGHEIVRRILLGDKYDASFISIVPGVTQIQGSWVRYLGIASSENHTFVEPTRQNIINELAVKAAGEMAEDIVAKGGRSTGGKQNDMTRSTHLAYRAILCLGLSDKFGVMSCPNGSSLEDMQRWMETSLPENKKKLVDDEVNAWLEEARKLARDVLVGNLELLEGMAVDLAEKGTLEAQELEQFYTNYNGDILHPKDLSPLVKLKRFSWSRFFTRFSHIWMKNDHKEPMFVPGVKMPEKIADISEIVRDKKQLALESVDVPNNIPVAKNADELRQRIEAVDQNSLPDVYKYGSCVSALKK